MSENLQFQRAEFADGQVAASRCAACGGPLIGSYYLCNGATWCEGCAAQASSLVRPTGARSVRVGKALLFGIGAAVAGAAIHYSVLRFLDINAALVTILMGYMVGAAVRKASGRRGGWRYQFIAVALTYFSISLAYLPFAIEGAMKGEQEKSAAVAPAQGGSSTEPGKKPASAVDDVAKPANEDASKPAAQGAENVAKAAGAEAEAEEPSAGKVLFYIGALLVWSLTLPVEIGLKDPLGLLIGGFGLWRAWQMNKPLQIQLTGPHRLAPSSPAAGTGRNEGASAAEV